MQTLQIVYISQRTPALDADALGDIVNESAARNAAQGISGLLLCSERHIMQLLEGASEKVEPLFQRIASDPRHHAVEVLLRKEVDRRVFPEWGMRLCRAERADAIDRSRLSDLITNLNAHVETGSCSVEARMLLHDFQQQLGTPSNRAHDDAA